MSKLKLLSNKLECCILFFTAKINVSNIELFSIGCCKTKTNEMTLANHKGQRKYTENQSKLEVNVHL